MLPVTGSVVGDDELDPGPLLPGPPGDDGPPGPPTLVVGGVGADG